MIDNLAVATDDVAAGIVDDICSRSTTGLRSAWQPLFPSRASDNVSQPADPANDPQRFLTIPTRLCSDWIPLLDNFDADTAAWRAIDANIPATEWTPEQKAINDAVAPVMTTTPRFERLGRHSDNPTLEDFAVLSAQYRRAFVKAIPTYTAADNYLRRLPLFWPEQ